MASIARPLSGRRVEREILERLTRSKKAELVAIYGRRRVGKTFLVRRFFADQPVTYFEMVGRFGGSTSDHLRIFSEALSRTFHAGVELAVPQSWHAAFRALQSAIERRRSKRKLVLFFDELPWMATHRSGCLEELEHFWNAWCSTRDDVLLIVCGSAASWMLRKIVNARGGLHNRLTQTIRLLPLTLPEVGAYFQDRQLAFTDRELVELYMILGGIPHYLDHVDRGRSVAQLVDRICLAKDGPLRGEVERLFTSLFEADEKYGEVVRTLAAKKRGMTRNELLEALDLASGGGVSKILESLEEGGFITSSIPFGRTLRDRSHRLTDELSLFHHAWMTRRPPTSWQHVRGSPRWRAWAGLAFEGVCTKHVGAVLRELGISGVETQVSIWRQDGAQIDLLIDRADDVISVCEVKFTDEPFTITKSYADELRRKLAVFRQATGTRKRLHLVFITSYGLMPNRYADELADCAIDMSALLR